MVVNDWILFAIYLGLSSIPLVAANMVRQRFHNFVYSRKLAHGLAGLIVLSFPFVFTQPHIPVALSVVLLLAFVLAYKNGFFHGVSIKGRYSEIYFAGGFILCFSSWYLVGPWPGIAAALFLAWGDGITGLVRYPLYHTQFEKGWGGSIAMLVSCLLIAIMVQPYWIGAVAAVVATIVEKQRWVDDNITIPICSILVMVGLLWLPSMN